MLPVTIIQPESGSASIVSRATSLAAPLEHDNGRNLTGSRPEIVTSEGSHDEARALATRALARPPQGLPGERHRGEALEHLGARPPGVAEPSMTVFQGERPKSRLDIWIAHRQHDRRRESSPARARAARAGPRRWEPPCPRSPPARQQTHPTLRATSQACPQPHIDRLLRCSGDDVRCGRSGKALRSDVG
jgi:hypothetical protein